MLAFLVTLFAAATAMTSQDYHPAVDQATLLKIRKDSPYIMSISSGAPVPYSEANSSLNADLIRQPFYMDLITHQNRERVNSRCAHQKATGAFGYYTPSNGLMSTISKADFFKPGKVTPVAMRLSLSTGERGVSELKSGTKGLAVKFYTEEGNYDMLCLSSPMFFTNNPMNFVKAGHLLGKKSSDYVGNRLGALQLMIDLPESLNMFMTVFSTSGYQLSYRHTPGFPLHTMQFVNSDGVISFGKYHLLPDAGIKYMTAAEALQKNLMNPDHYSADLRTAINNKEYPTWTVYIQHVTEDDVKRLGTRAIFDPVRFLDQDEFPLQEIGKITLNSTIKNFFADVEHAAYNPSNLVEGILGSPDLVFQGRTFAYTEAQLYRLGAHQNRIPVNCPHRIPGFKCRSSTQSPPEPSKGLLKLKYEPAYNFDQTQKLYENIFTETERNVMVQTMAAILSAAPTEMRNKVLDICKTAYAPMGDKIEQAINARIKKNP